MTFLRLWPRPAAWVAFSLLLPAAVPLAAQDPAQEETFSEAIDVSVVSLDVHVTDRKGKPLTGLTREDFEILEDGRPVEITNFYAENTESRTAVPQPPGPAGSAPAAAARPEDQRLRLVVFIDDVNLQLRSRTPVLSKLDEFLRRQLMPGDLAMLVRYDNSLEIRQGFTSDLDQLAAGLEALKEVNGDLRARSQSRTNAIMDVYSVLRAGGGRVSMESRIQSYAAQEAMAVAGSLDALSDVVGWLSGVPGRKAVLYVSDGLPLEPGYDLYRLYTEQGYFSRNRISLVGSMGNDATERFRKLTAHASRNRVTLYPLEAGGIRGADWEDYTMNAQNGLRFLAQDTGGRAMLNAADPLAALRLFGEDLETYYSLGYQPQRAADDREHKVEVRVKVKGASVRHRRWYRDKPAGEKIAERTLAVMRFGPEDNPLGATLEIGEQKAGGDGVLVPVRVRVPVSRLYLAARDGGVRAGSLRLYVVASGEGSRTPVRETETVTVQLPESEAAAGTAREYVHDVRITLKPGAYSVGVGILDEGAATASYLRKDFAVGEAQKGR